MPKGSIVLRKSIGRQLRALRHACRKTPADVEVSGVASTSKLHRIETGQVNVRLETVWALCRLYGASEESTDKLAELVKVSAEKGWWEAYSGVMPPWFALYVELEAAASRVFAYDPDLIHGLLQTVAYSQAVSAADPALTPELAERHLRLRRDRQTAAFSRTPTLEVSAILGEGALLRMVGGRQVMAEQRQHLLDLSRKMHIEVRVLTWDAGAHVAMKGAFTMIGFADEEDPDVIYLETHAGGRYVEDEPVITDYHQMWQTINEQSRPLEEYLK